MTAAKTPEMATPPAGAPRHHPDAGLLLDYASGALDWQQTLIVACHLSLCGQCRDAVADLEAVGGAMLHQIEPVAVRPGLLAQALTQVQAEAVTGADAPALRTVPGDRATAARALAGGGGVVFPAPLRALITPDQAEGRWRRVMPGLRRIELAAPAERSRLRLIRISAGRAMPRHSHGGEELTLVLAGSFCDQAGRYQPGDLIVADGSVSHQPVADPGQDCICLTVEETPPVLSARLGSLIGMVFPRAGRGTQA